MPNDVRHRRLHRSPRGGPDPHRGPAAPRVPRLRLGRDRPRRRGTATCSSRSRRASSRTSDGASPTGRRTPRSASRTRAGRPTAGRTTSTPTPHQDCTGDITVIHNGIIENFRELRDGLEARGHTLTSETDTEAIAHLVEEAYAGDLADAVRAALRQARGRVRARRDAQGRDQPARRRPPERAARRRAATARRASSRATSRRSSPTRTGSSSSRRATSPTSARPASTSPTSTARPRERAVTIIDWTPEAAEKGGYDHFMLKEIHEQPEALRQSHRRPRDARRPDPASTSSTALADAFRRGDAGGAGRVRHAPPTRRSSAPPRSRTGPGCRRGRRSARSSATRRRRSTATTLVIAVTQSGETADTIAPTRYAREQGCPIVAVTNTVGSAITREADAVMFLQAGPEIAVAASKTFVTQVTTLVDPRRGDRQDPRRPGGEARARAVGDALRALPERPPGALELAAARPRSLARRYVNSRGFMFVGRGYAYPGRARGRAQAQGDQLRPRRGLRGGRAQARPDLAARRRVPAGRGRDPVVGLRQADQQRDGGPGPRREGHRRGDRGRRPDRALRRRRAAGSPTRTRR